MKCELSTSHSKTIFTDRLKIWQRALTKNSHESEIIKIET